MGGFGGLHARFLTQGTVIGIGLDCSDHVGWVDVFHLGSEQLSEAIEKRRMNIASYQMTI